MYFFLFYTFKKTKITKVCVMVLFSLAPISRCGSVVLDFMMKFNQSVIVSNVLTFLSDAARQGKFGAFKVDPGSIKQVFNGLESTTQGKYHKGRWLVFPKVFTGIISFENDGLFYLYSESIFFKQPFLRERGKVWANLIWHLPVIVVVVLILLNKIWFLQIS